MGHVREELASLGVGELRARFADREPTRAEWEALQADPRSGAVAVVRTIEKRRKREAAESRRLYQRLKYERALWESGLELVAGCDEAGMGPLAGPVVAAAVNLRKEERIREVDDSKALTAEVREELAEDIRARAVSWAIGLATPAEIDSLNIKRAGLLAMLRALRGLSPQPQHCLMDAFRVKEFAVPQTPIIKGDSLSLTIGAASILAKTHRDGLLVELDQRYPGYGFSVHKGYGVATHLEALRRLGPCPEHRRSFAPVREALDGGPRQSDLFASPG
jgi:ribonuclease HII